MTKDQFDKEYVGEKIVVNCKSEESANKFLEIADGFGYAWSSCDSYERYNLWDVYEESTCYSIFEGLYGSREYFKAENYEIKAFDCSVAEA